MTEFGKFEKGNRMPKKTEVQEGDNASEKPAQMQQSEIDEEELIGDQTHDHLWWGKAGRPTERNGLLAGDDASSQEKERGAHSPYTGGHDSDWQEK